MNTQDSRPIHPRAQSGAHRRRRRLAVLVIVILCGAMVAACWSWREYSQPELSLWRQGTDDASAGRLAQAEQELLSGARADPASPLCWGALGELYLKEGRYREALMAYQAASKRAPQDGGWFLAINRAALALNDNPTALSAIRRAAELRPDDPDAFGLYGLLAVKRKDSQTARKMLQRALALRPDDPDYLLALVRVELDEHDTASAARDLTPYFRSHPDDPESCFLMATIIKESPHTPETLETALSYARRALAKLPDDVRVLGLLGDILLEQNHTAEALTVYQAGLRQDPDDTRLLTAVMTCDTRLGKSSDAAAAGAHLKKVVDRRMRMAHLNDICHLTPSNIEAGLELARLQEDDGKPQDANNTYQRLIRTSPHDPRINSAFASFRQRTGYKDTASSSPKDSPRLP